ncbi:helix-turn-helix transcriptional regulator [Magnetospira sp. QH-2]|uniref:ArsR/SmtB family transcription factor n=1 Tax=Magnetospira sp. (strain QH-2) TaxID=1288970 RepID=UPI0003E80B54|nr:metalloregulator ArsR/SmtB family transcription factor [Magnetospira sp. QH-2]CCQ72699.1 putative transcriptional regulatory protein, arsR family; arsR1 [Magnetospira sp. QH-2]
MDTDTAANRLEALGNATRLSVYRLLVKAGEQGLVVGDLRRALDIPPSTLSHHLAHLVRAGLVIQERNGRELVCRADYGVMDSLLGFLTDECCAGGTCAITKTGC